MSKQSRVRILFTFPPIYHPTRIPSASDICFVAPPAYSSLSVLRFVSGKRTAYTADFVISPNSVNGSPVVGSAPGNPAATFVLPNTTIISQLAPTKTMDTPQTVYPNPLKPGQDVASGGKGHYHNSASSLGSTRVDLEKLKFRLVFIVWPALIGISMAL